MTHISFSNDNMKSHASKYSRCLDLYITCSEKLNNNNFMENAPEEIIELTKKKRDHALDGMDHYWCIINYTIDNYGRLINNQTI